MENKNTNKEVLLRAKNYPYPRPRGSYLLESDRIIELKGRVLDGNLKKFVPVLAYGSNASPDQLRRKLPEIREPIAVLEATLMDIDVIFSAHFSRYGALPATLVNSPGAKLYTHVVMLKKQQLNLIHKTEMPDYTYGIIKKPILIDRVGFRECIYAYFFDHGYTVDGRFVSFEEIHTENRKYVSMKHPDMLELAGKKIDSNSSFDKFILSMVDNEDVFKKNKSALQKESLRIKLDCFEPILLKAKK